MAGASQKVAKSSNRGSAPGERRGGRKPNVPNKASIQRQAEIAASGLTPLEYLTSVYRDESADPDRRDYAAKAAAPYVHPKLAQIAHTGPDGNELIITVRDV